MTTTATAQKTTTPAAAGGTPKTATVRTNKSCTTLLCELTRLKSQQKYLECNQMKLNPDNFEDYKFDEATNMRTSSSATTKQIKEVIVEIEQLRLTLEEELRAYRETVKDEVQDVRTLVYDIKMDVFQPERLKEYSVRALRERIIAIDTELSRLSVKNASQLDDLQQECKRLERETRILLK